MCFQEVSHYGGRRPASSLAPSPSSQAASITTKRRCYFDVRSDRYCVLHPRTQLMCLGGSSSEGSSPSQCGWRWPDGVFFFFSFCFACENHRHARSHACWQREDKTSGKLRRDNGDRRPPSFQQETALKFEFCRVLNWIELLHQHLFKQPSTDEEDSLLPA